jgi:hypothetical protein
VQRTLSRLILSILVSVTTVLALTTVEMPVASATAAPDIHPEWGDTAAKNATVKRGCHKYEYAYSITPPPGDWALETFLVGPGGKASGSGYFVTGKDALAGTSSWRLCRRTVKGGRYTIKAKLSIQNGADLVEGWLPPSKFRLRKPR